MRCLSVSMMLLLVGVSASAGLLNNEDCSYNGKKYDPSIPAETKTHIPSIPETFKGQVDCTDPSTKKVYSEFLISNGQKNGLSKEYDRSSGKLRSVQNFLNDRLDGPSTEYNSDKGFIIFERNYKMGRLLGPQKEFNSDTGKLSRIFLADENEQPDTDLSFNKKGKLMMIECGKRSVVPDDEVWCGRSGKVGQVKIYSREESKLSEVRSYKNGVKQGEWIKYHMQGYPMQKTVYENGKMVSEVDLDAKGQEKYKEMAGAEKGSREVQSTFPNSAKVQYKATYKDGSKIAETEYYENGKIKLEMKIENSLQNVKHYFDNGKLRLTVSYATACEFYFWCIPQGKSQRFSKDGQLWFEENWNQGKREGSQKYFDENGQISFEEFYEKGTRKWSIEQYGKNDLRKKREYAADGSITKETILPPANKAGNTLI